MFKKCDRLGYTALVPPTGSCGCSLRVWVGVGILWESLHYKLAIEMNVSANVSISGRVMEKAVEEEWMNVQTTKCFKEEIILKETGLFECKKTKKRNCQMFLTSTKKTSYLQEYGSIPTTRANTRTPSNRAMAPEEETPGPDTYRVKVS